MLVLSRKQGERIFIGPDISVTLVEIRGDSVRLGIEADKSIPVHREEVANRIALAAAHVDAGTIDIGEDQLDAAEVDYDDVAPCMGCGNPVVCVPEGLALCNKCAEENAAEKCDALHLQCPDKCPMFGELCDVCIRWPYGNSHSTGHISTCEECNFRCYLRTALRGAGPIRCPMRLDVKTNWKYAVDNVIPETGMECCEISSAETCRDCDGSPAIDDQFTGDLPPDAERAPFDCRGCQALTECFEAHGVVPPDVCPGKDSFGADAQITGDFPPDAVEKPE